MPRYHFNIHDGEDIPDADGHELPDLDAAQREAVNLASHAILALGAEFWKGDEWTMDVTDHAGLILFQLVFHSSTAAAMG